MMMESDHRAEDIQSKLKMLNLKLAQTKQINLSATVNKSISKNQ
jgi:hypothetical protein